MKMAMITFKRGEMVFQRRGIHACKRVRHCLNQELVHYQRQSEHQRTDDIQDDERSAAVFAHDIGELPDTAQPYGTACGGQQDSNF